MPLTTEFGQRIQTQPRPFCRDCGGQMYLRTPKPDQTWAPFWGCSQYPDCKGSRDIDPRTGEPERLGEREPLAELELDRFYRALCKEVNLYLPVRDVLS